MKTLLLTKRGGIRYSSARNGAETSIGGEAPPHVPEACEADHSLGGRSRLKFHTRQ